MYAYSMAAAHEKLPHLQVNHYMVSNLDSGYTEGWKWIDDLPQVCIPSKDGIYYPDHNLPTVAHFCQSYRVGEFMFTKRRVPHNIFECDQPLFIDLPSDIVKNNFFYQKNEVRSTSMIIFSITLTVTGAMYDDIYRRKSSRMQGTANEMPLWFV